MFCIQNKCSIIEKVHFIVGAAFEWKMLSCDSTFIAGFLDINFVMYFKDNVKFMAI